MRRKTYFAALTLSLMLVLSSCGSAATGKKADLNAFILSESLALTREMGELAESDEYRTLVGVSGSVEEIVRSMGAEDYGLPDGAYLVDLDEDLVMRSSGISPTEGDIPESVVRKIRQQLGGSLVAYVINARYGATNLAATSVVAWGKSYIQPDGWSDSVLLLLEYPGEFSSMVSFVQSGDGVIAASSMFVKNGGEDMLTMLGDYLGIEDVSHKSYSEDEIRDALAVGD